MKVKGNGILLIGLCFILNNCSKKDQPASERETNILTYRIENSQAKVNILASQHSINIAFPNSVINAENLIADFTLSPACKATIKNIEQISGVSKNNYSKVFFYTVSASGNSTDWKVTATNNNYTASMGLGNFIQQNASNDRSYSWYMDQMNTGYYSYINCGPTTVTMACKWADTAFAKTPEDARTAYRPGGGDWYADDITFYLRDNDIPNSTLALPATAEGTMQTLKREVDLHQVVILLLDMNFVRFTTDVRFSHADRFYTTYPESYPEFGHFIIIKGYKQVDDEMYFDVYDSNSFGTTYDDFSLMGKDRYYRYEDLFEATKTYWPKAFIIAKKGTAVIE